MNKIQRPASALGVGVSRFGIGVAAKVIEFRLFFTALAAVDFDDGVLGIQFNAFEPRRTTILRDSGARVQYEIPVSTKSAPQ